MAPALAARIASIRAETDRRRAVVVAVLVLVVIGVPLATALVAMHDPPWYPTIDWAIIELRVREVGTPRTPLIGSPSRFVGLGHLVSHPGPLFLWVLAPIYRLLGSTSFALLVSTAVLSAGAVATSLWIAVRRGGLTLALVVAAVSAVLVHALTAERLSVPWNPWLTVPWWIAFLLSVWSVLADDVRLAPLAVVSGAICAQTHLAFAPSVAVLTAVVFGWLLVRRSYRVAIVAVALLEVLWAPVVLDQLVHHPGNLSIVVDHLLHPVEPRVRLPAAANAWLAHLDLRTLVTGHQRLDGGAVPAAVLLLCWGAAASVAWRRGDRDLLALHATAGVALVLGVLSISRVTGGLFEYFLLWLWATTAFVVVAIAWTVITTQSPSARLRSLATPALAATVAVSAVASTVGAAHASPQFAGLSKTMRSLEHPVISALQENAKDGAHPRYVIAQDDPFAGELLAWTLLLDLNRHGIDANLTPDSRLMAGGCCVLALDDATSVILYATGDHIDRWRADPNAVEIGHVDVPEAARRALETRREAIKRALVRDGVRDLADRLDDDAFHVAIDSRLPRSLVDDLDRLLELQVPTAVFLVPKDDVTGRT